MSKKNRPQAQPGSSTKETNVNDDQAQNGTEVQTAADEAQGSLENQTSGTEGAEQGTSQPSPEENKEVVVEQPQAAVVVGDASAPIGQAVVDVVATAEKFADQVINANEQAVLAELNLIGYSPELTKHLLAAFNGETELHHVALDTLKNVLAYSSAMAQNVSITEETGHHEQAKLINTLLGFFNTNQDARLTFSLILAIVKESMAFGGGFSGVLPFRFMESVAMHAEKRRALVNLIHLLTATADPATRAEAVRQIDLQKAASFGLTEVGKQALIGFYSI